MRGSVRSVVAVQDLDVSPDAPTPASRISNHDAFSDATESSVRRAAVVGRHVHAATAAGHRAARERSRDGEGSNPNPLSISTTAHSSGSGSQAPSLAGKRVGRYIVDRLLGKGGMATVWRAVHEQLGGEVAIKVLTPSSSGSNGEGELERFFREAKVSAMLNHDHVVKVIDFARDPEVGAYIVMELLNGRGLDRVLAAEGPMEEGRAVSLALQVTDALTAAHERGIVHRDLKPANIFVTRTVGTEIAKVMDFGIAKSPMSKAIALTQPGQICGTPLYMSPEQWDAGPISEASDIYSFGVVLYEMLSGKRPIDDASLTKLVKNVALKEPTPLSHYRPNVSPELAAIVQRCLRKRPEQRYSTMREVRDALERVFRLGATQTMYGRALSSGVHVRPRRGLIALVASTVAIASLVAGGLFATGRWHPGRDASAAAKDPAALTTTEPAAPAGEVAASAATVSPNEQEATAPSPPPTSRSVATTPSSNRSGGPAATASGRRGRPTPSSSTSRPRAAGPSKSANAPSPAPASTEDDLLRKD
jgi:serine/threonine-protein kinase